MPAIVPTIRGHAGRGDDPIVLQRKLMAGAGTPSARLMAPTASGETTQLDAHVHQILAVGVCHGVIHPPKSTSKGSM